MRSRATALIFATGALCGLLSHSQAQETAESELKTVSRDVIEQRVLELFEASCAECHDESRGSRVKGDFGYVMDLRRMVDEEFYVVPEAPEDSELFLLMIDPDPDLVMPPPESDAYQPTPMDIELVRTWILTLNEPDDAIPVGDPGLQKMLGLLELPEAEAADVVLLPVKIETEKKISPKRLFARTHPMVVHFPVALLLLGAMVAWTGRFTGKSRDWVATVRWALWVSAITAPLAVGAGWILAGTEGYSDATVFLHRWIGVGTAVSTFVCLTLVELGERRDSQTFRNLALLALAIAAILVSIAGHTGGELVYGEGYPFN